MSRPQRDNRITPTMIGELSAALDLAESDDTVRAVVLTADAPVFCLGCDHYELRTLGTSDTTALKLVEQVKALCNRFETLAKPIVAAVNGNAKGGGFELLLACDIIVAVEGARIGDAHAGFTLPGAGSVTRSSYRLGASMARYLQLSGDMLPAAEMVGCGFVRQAVPVDRLVETVDAVVEGLCSKTPAASRRLKQALLNAMVETRSDALAREYVLFDQQTHEPEVKEGMMRLNELLNAQTTSGHI